MRAGGYLPRQGNVGGGKLAGLVQPLRRDGHRGPVSQQDGLGEVADPDLGTLQIDEDRHRAACRRRRLAHHPYAALMEPVVPMGHIDTGHVDARPHQFEHHIRLGAGRSDGGDDLCSDHRIVQVPFWWLRRRDRRLPATCKATARTATVPRRQRHGNETYSCTPSFASSHRSGPHHEPGDGPRGDARPGRERRARTLRRGERRGGLRGGRVSPLFGPPLPRPALDRRPDLRARSPGLRHCAAPQALPRGSRATRPSSTGPRTTCGSCTGIWASGSVRSPTLRSRQVFWGSQAWACRRFWSVTSGSGFRSGTSGPTGRRGHFRPT